MVLLSIIRKSRLKDREVRVLMLYVEKITSASYTRSGLDNAGSSSLRIGLSVSGKTTMVKRINGEDILSVSPTLGFNITTLEHRGCVNAVTQLIWQLLAQHLGRGRPKNAAAVLAELLWQHGRAHLGCRLDRRRSHGRLPD